MKILSDFTFSVTKSFFFHVVFSFAVLLKQYANFQLFSPDKEDIFSGVVNVPFVLMAVWFVFWNLQAYKPGFFWRATSAASENFWVVTM